MRDANAAAHNAQRQQVQQNVGGQAPPIATQVKHILSSPTLRIMIASQANIFSSNSLSS